MDSNSRRRKPKNLSKKQKFIKDGVFYAELNDLLAQELAEQGYAGCDVRVTPKKTEIIIHANKTMKVVGDDGRRARELTKLIEKRFMFEPGTIKIFAQRIKNRGLSALSQAEAVRFRLFEGLSVRRACYSVLKWIMDRGAKGCEVVVSGKLRGQRAKSMKFREGYMIHAGDATNYYIDTAIKHVHLRQGVLGIKVKIMLPHKNDPGRGGRDGGQNQGVEKQLPDTVKIRDPKDVDPDRMNYETQKMNKQRGVPNFSYGQQRNMNQQQDTQQQQQQQQDNQQQMDNQQQDNNNNNQQFDPNQQQFQQQEIQQQIDPNLLQHQQQQQQMEQQYNNQYQNQGNPQYNPPYQQQQYDSNQQQQQQGGFQQYQ